MRTGEREGKRIRESNHYHYLSCRMLFNAVQKQGSREAGSREAGSIAFSHPPGVWQSPPSSMIPIGPAGKD